MNALNKAFMACDKFSVVNICSVSSSYPRQLVLRTLPFM
jgi:hypothetical protein